MFRESRALDARLQSGFAVLIRTGRTWFRTTDKGLLEDDYDAYINYGIADNINWPCGILDGRDVTLEWRGW
jgi:hypothetical protein